MICERRIASVIPSILLLDGKEEGDMVRRSQLRNLSILLFILTLVVFNQAWGGVNIHYRNIIITGGEYVGNEYKMTAKGQDYTFVAEDGGDPWYFDLPREPGIRLSDARVRYTFEVPHELYDHRLITEFRVEVNYDRVDHGDTPGPTLECYDFQNKEPDIWRRLEVTADGAVKYTKVTTPGVYSDDDQYHIGKPGSGGDAYRIVVELDAPDGPGSADDDAEVDINWVYVFLILKQPHPPEIHLQSPSISPKNNKVNKPVGGSVRLSVQADAPTVSGYSIWEYQWKQQSATEEAPSVVDEFDRRGDAPEINLTFFNPGNYVIYCKVLYKKKANPKMRETIFSKVFSIPLRIWNRPTVAESPPQEAINRGDISWYDGKYVGVIGHPIRLMADGSTNNGGDDQIVKFVWDLGNGQTADQPYGQVVSATWNRPSENAQIRCRAVTNYGIYSEGDASSAGGGQTFNLTVYDALQINPSPKGSYTGRANTSITLSGSLRNLTSYTGAAIEYQWRMNSFVPEAALRGDAKGKGDYIELTQAQPNQSGQVEYQDLSLSDDWSVRGEFWSGGGTGADAFYIYLWADRTPTSEDDNAGQYAIVFDEWTDEIQLKYNGTDLTSPKAQPIPLDNGEWRPFRVVFYKGTFRIYLDHRLKLEYTDPDYQGRMSGNLFGFGGRTGSKTNFHRVRNMEWTPGTPVETSDRGEAKYSWSQEGTYRAAFTVRLTTPEGMVIEDTEFTDVIVEAGVPTAQPGGPYRGGIAGGNYSPIQFEGNHPDYVEAEDVGKITDWRWFFSDRSNKALQLDGNDDYVIANPISNGPTEAFTIEFWMKSDDQSRYGCPVSYATSSYSYNDIQIFNYRDFTFRVTNYRSPATGSTGISANDGYWHHIALTWQSSDGQLRFYKDGVEVFTDTVAQGRQLISGGAFVVGQEQDALGGGFDPGQAFAGLIDEVMLWNVVRTGEQIQNDMKGELTGNESGLVLYWKFEEGEGTIAHDQSGRNDGTLGNMAPEAWSSEGHPTSVSGIWNPAYSYVQAGRYEVGLKVLAESGKWSRMETTGVTVVDGKIAGYVHAADLRTPVREVSLFLTSSHVARDALVQAASTDDEVFTDTIDTAEGKLWVLRTETDENGYYEFPHLPLGSYRIRVAKGEGDTAHEFDKRVRVTELTLDAPNQLAIDFVDLSVFPVGGRVVYSIKKNNQDVLVKDVIVTAQPVGSTSAIEALPSTKSLSSGTSVNYSLPLFAGKYYMLAKREGHEIRIKENTPGYDPDTGLITIEEARNDVDFVDHTTRKLTVIVRDSGENPIARYPDNFSNAGDPIKVTVNGINGNESGVPVNDEGKLELTLNPGEYTVTIEGADPENKEVDLTGDDQTVTMTIPVKIQLEITSLPPSLIPQGLWDELMEDEDIAAFMNEFGITKDDIPEGYLYYYPPSPIQHVYVIKATANGQPVSGYVLTVLDEISQMTPDPPTEKEVIVPEGESEVEVTVVGGLPKLEFDENNNPYAGEKFITFQASKERYKDSDPLKTGVTILGDLPKGSAEQLIAIPNLNYTVLHDPPGDDSYSYLDDKAVIRGAIQNMSISFPDPGGDAGAIPIYPAPWSRRNIDGFEGGVDLSDKGLLQPKPSKSDSGDDYDSAASNYMISVGIRFGITGGKVGLGKLAAGVIAKISEKVAKKWAGPVAAIASFPLGLAFNLVRASYLKEKTDSDIIPQIQYEIRPRQRIQTPRGDTTSDLIGPGRGDIYIGEGWLLILRDNYRFGITWNETQGTWEQQADEIKTFTVERDERNQYIYTTRDIEQIVSDLNDSIETLEPDSDERKKLESSRNTWQQLLNYNKAYRWNRYYVDNAAKIAMLEAKSERTEEEQRYLSELRSVSQMISAKGGDAFEAFKEVEGLSQVGYETLLFSGGPVFEYSRSISEGYFATYTTSAFYYNEAKLGSSFLMLSPPPSLVGIPITVRYEIGGGDYVGTKEQLFSSMQSGQQVDQTVGFVLHDDDVGDQIATYVYKDLRWGTPMFFQDAGSYTSDPWEAGTSRAVDVRLDLVEQPTGPFDYQEGAHYTIKLIYTGKRAYSSGRDSEHRSLQTVDFALYAPSPDNPGNLTVKFNGTHEPYTVRLNQDLRSATIALSIYPPEKDRDNRNEKKYELKIMAQEAADPQIARLLTLSPTFADLRAPRATVVAPYDGERISPVFFPSDKPFEIKVVSQDTDLASIQLQIRSKQPDGVWEPWYNLSGMKWEDGGTNENVTVFDRLDRRPPRREFTFRWPEDQIRNLGVGEYALRAVATDKATPNPNTDIDPPFVVFMVDEAKPSVLSTIPDYQARESERIYRGELSITFTDDMRADEFTDRTFYVMDLLNDNRQVAGYVSYSPALRKAVFVPVTPFQPNGFYRVQMKTDEDTDGDGIIDVQGVHDLAGNPLDTTFFWTFRTTDAPFEPTWSLNWRVSDGTMIDSNNIAAVEYGATDGEDEKDVRAVPALASQMRMCFLDRDKNEFDRDIRPADGRLAHHWFFVIDNVRQGATVTLEYQPSVKLTKTTRQYQVLRLVEFDQQGNVSNIILLHPEKATVDEAGFVSYVQAYQYTAQGESSRYFRLDVQKASYVASELEVGTSGWRFFSVPITPQRAEPFVNLGDDIDPFQLFQYDTRSGGYKVYPYDIGEVGLQTAHGYFTRLVEDVNVDVGGAMNQSDVTITLDNPGWHAIGNPFIKEVQVSDLQVNGQAFDVAVSSGVIEGTLYRWKIVTKEEAYKSEVPISDGYYPVESGDTLRPWEGYWIKTNQANVTLTIPAPPNLPNRAPTPDYLKPPMAPIAAATERQKDKETRENLSLTFRLLSNFASDTTTTLGTYPDAKMGRDRFDRSEPPTLSKTVALYFDHQDWGENAGLYNVDYQPPMKAGESRTWHLTVYTDQPDAKMMLSWEDGIRKIPDDVMLLIRRLDLPDDEWLDMRQVDHLLLPSTSRITEIPLEIRAGRFEMSLPDSIQVVAGERLVHIRWSEVENPFIQGYIVERTTERQGDKGTRRFELSPLVHEFVDTDVEEEMAYTYRLIVRFRSGAELRSDPFTVTVLPFIKETALLQSYPNPFNPEVWIPYELAEEAPVKILIYDSAGRLVRTLDLGIQPRGRYTRKSKAAYWDGRNEQGDRVASGVYFYALKAGKFTRTRKMVIRK
jgi:hypothetical protein